MEMLRKTNPTFCIIVEHNQNTFVWCQIKRTKCPFYGILELLQYIISKNYETYLFGFLIQYNELWYHFHGY